MPHPDRPRTFLEALFDHPFVGSDNAEQGIGPTLGEDVGEPPLRPAPSRNEPRVFAPKPRPPKRP